MVVIAMSIMLIVGSAGAAVTGQLGNSPPEVPNQSPEALEDKGVSMTQDVGEQQRSVEMGTTTPDPNAFSDGTSVPVQQLPGDGIRNTANATNLTLITGQQVTVVNQSGQQRYFVDAEGMERMQTQQGTFIFPEGTDFSRYDRDLFNVDLLVEQGLTDDESSSIPVIVEGQDRSGDVSTTVQALSQTFEESRGAEVTTRLRSIGGVAAEIEKPEAAQLGRTLAADDAVSKIHLDVVYEVSLDDASELVDATSARSQYGVSGENTTVAVIDTGVNESHPALDDDEVFEKDFTDEGTTEDVNGHGSHVAGIITADPAASDGEYGGIAPNAFIMDLRALDSSGRGRTSWIIDAMEYAADNGADIVSMSLGGPIDEVRSESIYEYGVEYATDRGVPVVVAAGNDGPYYNSVGDPGVQREAITVGASRKDGTIADFSSRGPTNGYFMKPDVVAPGANITSVDASGGYVTYSGTSMATPVVSGVAALMLERNASLSPQAVKSRLMTTADSMPGGPYTTGAGQVNATAALDTSLQVAPTPLDFGSFSNDSTDSEVITVTNTGDETRVLNVSRTLERLSGSVSSASVQLNRTQVSIEPGERESIRLTIETGDELGVFGGRISIGNHVVPYGFARVARLAIVKNGIDGTSVADDSIQLLPDNPSNLRPKTSFYDVDETKYYETVRPGNLTLISPGTNEETGQMIFSQAEVYANESKTVYLNESETDVHEIDTSSFAESGETIQAVGAQIYVSWFRQGDYIQTGGGFGESTDDPALSFRVSPTFNETLKVGYVMIDRSESPANRSVRFDTDSVYLLPRVYDGVPPADISMDRDDFARQDVSLYDQLSSGAWWFDVALSAQFVFPGTFDGGVAGRQSLSVYYDTNVTGDSTPSKFASSAGFYTRTFYGGTEGTPPYGFDDYEPKIGTSEPFGYFNSSYRYFFPSYYTFQSPDAGAEIETAVNRHPYTGGIARWNTSKEYSDILANLVFKRGQSAAMRGLVSDKGTGEIQVFKNGERIRRDTTNLNTQRDGEVEVKLDTLDDGDDIRIETIGSHPNSTVSPRTMTTYQVEYDSNGDSRPPEVERINFLNQTLSNTIPAGDQTFRVEVNDTSGIESVRVFAGQDANSPPSEGRDDWTNVELTEVEPGVYEGTFDVAPTGRDVDISVEVTDENGNSMQTTTIDGLEVTASELTKEWEVDTGGRSQHSTPAVTSDMVVIGGLDSTVKAMYRENGTVAWTYERSGSLADSSPTISDGTVYIGDGGGAVLALDSDGGTERWSHSVDSAVVSSPTVVDGTVFVGSNGGTVFALDSTTGDVEWQTDVGAAVLSSVTVADGTAYVTTDSGRLVALDRNSGETRWRFDTPASFGHTSPTVENDTIYLAADSMYALDASDGSVRWETSYNGTAGSTPTVGGDTVYVGSSDGTIYALRTSSGAVEWTHDTGGPVASNPTIVGETVVVSSVSGTFFLLDGDTGAVRASRFLGSPTRSSPVVFDSEVYIGSRNGAVHAFLLPVEVTSGGQVSGDTTGGDDGTETDLAVNGPGEESAILGSNRVRARSSGF